MHRRHDMPFGAQVLADGRVRFRLWAPAARRIDLGLEGPNNRLFLPMRAGEQGWHELVSDRAGPGSLYCFRIDSGPCVPDPASRRQPRGVHGPSQVIDPEAWSWADTSWPGRPWQEAVFYELHVGSFTAAGTFAGVEERLDHLAALGITAVELMPVADFPGERNWGYDGVLPFAPARCYGGPEDLKRLVQAAHARNLMVFLDVVYNHFGPEGNYLHLSAPCFFTDRHHTPWGDAINFSGPHSFWVRRFFIENALYWLEEYHFDGLRLDAAHAIHDDSHPHILDELARTVRQRFRSRQVHIVLENDANQAGYLPRKANREARLYSAQWNDDCHHALHVLLTGETDGYYQDYAASPLADIGRCLSEGFAFQGRPSPYRRNACRGEPSRKLPPEAFVNFLQNHDQVGNRALGERLTLLTSPAALRAATVLLLLAPSPPLLFMGQEWGERKPFLFFCDFSPDLADPVREGRRREFARFPRFRDAEGRELIPDPGSETTFRRSCLDWQEPAMPEARQWLELHRALLAIRQQEIVPLLARIRPGQAKWDLIGASGLRCRWPLADGATLVLDANLGDENLPLPDQRNGLLLYPEFCPQPHVLGPWEVRCRLVPAGRSRKEAVP